MSGRIAVLATCAARDAASRGAAPPGGRGAPLRLLGALARALGRPLTREEQAIAVESYQRAWFAARREVVR